MRYTSSLILKHPNSYHAKEQIKALGGKWVASEKGWKMPDIESYNKAYDACDNVSESIDRRSQAFDTNVGTWDDWGIAEIFPHTINWEYTPSANLNHLWHGAGVNDCFYVGKVDSKQWVIALRCHHSYKEMSARWGTWDNIHKFWYKTLEVTGNDEFVEQVKIALLEAAYLLKNDVPSTVRLQFKLKPGTQEKMLAAFKKGIVQK